MPIRSCIVCRKKDEKNNLLRIVSNEKYFEIDRKQKINKRAIYLCNNIECIEKAIKMIKKGKLKTKIGINTNSLEVLLNEVKIELGE